MDSRVIFGGVVGAPIGTMVTTPGVITDPDWIALDGQVRNKSAYPDLDTSKMLTFDGNSLVAGPTLAASSGGYKVFHVTDSTWYAYSISPGSTQCYRSTDNGATWTSGTLPVAPASLYWTISYANGLFFLTKTDATPTSTYYTSTDGLSWTTRTLPVTAGGHVQNYGGVAYIAGRFVLLPAWSNVSLNAAISFYSTDGITGWTQSTIASNSSGGASAATTGLLYNVQFGKADVSRRLGLQLSTSNLSGSAQFITLDGISWQPVSRLSVSMTVDTSISSGANIGLTASDDYSSSTTFIYVGNSARGGHRTNAGLGGFPMRGTNITVHGGFSEDHGLSRNSPALSWYSASTDFSGSRLLNISTSGAVTWIDVNTTKFRAIAPLCPAELPLIGQTIYIKAR